MALTLDPALAAAQDSQKRHPLAEIVSSQRVSDIPFDGTRLTGETFSEYDPSVIAHSSGRLVLAYIADTGGATARSQIKFVYTDIERTAFTTVTFDLYAKAFSEILSVSICEMTGGNIGMVLLVNDKTGHVYRLIRRIYTVAGVAVSDAEIASWSHDTYTSDLFVLTKGVNDYLLVYGKISGTDYYIYKRTSSDFATWSAESALSIAGLTSTWKLGDPSLLKLMTGDIWLWFYAVESTGPNGEELSNVYYSISSDDGANWGTAQKFTSYDTYSEIAKHPFALQKIATSMHLMFTKQVSALHMDDTVSGWPTGDAVTGLSFDSVNRKLYVDCTSWGGWNHLDCIVRIDVDTWTCDKFWDETSTPAAFPAAICDSGLMLGMPFVSRYDQDIIPVAYGIYGVCVLEGEADVIHEYYWKAGGGKAVNVSGLPASGVLSGDWDLCGTQADAANRRIYICLVDYGVTTPGFILGYISLDDAGSGSPVMYAWHTVCRVTTWTQAQTAGLRGNETVGEGGFLVVPDEDIAIFSSAPVISGGVSRLTVMSLSANAILYDFTMAANPDFPRWGIRQNFYYAGNKIYGGFKYYATQADYRGLCILDLTRGECTYSRPTYATLDEYALKNVCAGPTNKLIISAYGYGVAIYDLAEGTWDLFSNSNVPNLTSDGYHKFFPVSYDSTREFVFVGACGSFAWQGAIMFSIYGFIQQATYRVGTWGGAAWSWATADNLVQGYLDHEAVGVPDPGKPTSMFVFWQNETWAGVKRIKWDKDGTELDLAPYITGEISTEHSIEGQPAKLSFSVSHGHLFDPYNLQSTFNIYLRKGRKLTLRWGEKISGTDYWQNAGTFYVSGTTLSFKRGDYPVMKVEAEDARCIWSQHHVYATEFYNALPNVIVEDVLKDHAGLAVTEMNVPTFTGGITLQHQWLDTTIDEIVNQVCNRFGYYFRFDVDGLAHARPISNVAAVDHVYSDSTKLFEYSPDDRYSDFTNRVTVQGQELDFREVLFAEEAVGRLNGTVGWWGFRKDFQVWYSDDHSRQCRYPRLHVIETATSIAFRLAGSISESITASATDELSCTVTVSAPNLIPLLAAGLGIWAAACAIPDMAPQAPAGCLPTIPVGRLVEKVGLLICIMVLASTGNFQYEIYAQPVGKIRRSVQASWDDEEHQAEIGAIIEKVINDPLCYSVTDCNTVAAFEGMVAQMQRKRLSFTKVAHLQDEEGDTIQIVHPYSGQVMTVFVTNLRRKFKKAVHGSADGYFMDEIEGWVCG